MDCSQLVSLIRINNFFKSLEDKFFDLGNYIKTQIKKRMKETKVELLP